MAEHTGLSVAAVQARQAALVARHSQVSDVDSVLREAVARAHAATVAGLARIDAIAEEIERAVQNQAVLALDTPLGNREFQKFLVAKQHEIISIVTEACELADLNKAALHAIMPHYTQARTAGA